MKSSPKGVAMRLRIMQQVAAHAGSVFFAPQAPSAHPFACTVIIGVSMIVGAGCNAPCSSIQQPETAVELQGDAGIALLESSSGIIMPHGARCISYDDGGERNAPLGYRCWTARASSAIELPKMNATGVEDHLALPLESSVRFVESRMNESIGSEPRYAFFSEWIHLGSRFTGTIVRCVDGDYLVLEEWGH